VACRWPAMGVRHPAVAKFPAAAGMGLVLVGLAAVAGKMGLGLALGTRRGLGLACSNS
jgi:hypothetical protein